MKNFNKTLIVVVMLSLISIFIGSYIQIKNSSLVSGCSYLDPPLIDYLAFTIALFLIIEGFARILEHKSASLKRQSTRFIRIGIGCAILSVHIIQFVNK